MAAQPPQVVEQTPGEGLGRVGVMSELTERLITGRYEACLEVLKYWMENGESHLPFPPGELEGATRALLNEAGVKFKEHGPFPRSG